MQFSEKLRAMTDPSDPRSERTWSQVGHVSVVLGIPFAIPILIGFFWLGQLSARVDGTEKQLSSLLTVVSGLVTLDASQTEKIQYNAVEVGRLRMQVEDLIRITSQISPPSKPR